MAFNCEEIIKKHIGKNNAANGIFFDSMIGAIESGGKKKVGFYVGNGHIWWHIKS